LDTGRNRGGILRILVRLIGPLAIILAVFLVAYLYLLVKDIEKKTRLKPEEADKVEKATEQPKPGEPFYLLLVGADRRPDWKVGRADTIMILRMDTKNKMLHLLSIPRDSRVIIPGRGQDKINHSLAYGGAPLLIDTIEDYTGIEINYYMQVDFEGFSEIIDAIDGVYFNVDKSWGNWARIPQDRYGNHKRDGKEALALLRLRNYPDGDFTRIKHQQQFIREALKQAEYSYTDIPKLASLAASHTKTNMEMGEMFSIGRALIGNDFKLRTATIPGKTGMINGISYVFPDEGTKDKLVDAMKEGREFPK